jgi:hypothetical protein
MFSIHYIPLLTELDTLSMLFRYKHLAPNGAREHLVPRVAI